MSDNNKRSTVAIKGEDGVNCKRRKFTLEEYVQKSANGEESEVNNRKIEEKQRIIGLIEDAQSFVQEHKDTIRSHGTWVQLDAVNKLENKLSCKMEQEALALKWVQRKKETDPIMATFSKINDTLKLDVEGLEKM